MVGLLITGIAGAGVYVMKLRSDNAILKANQVKLEEAVRSQKELIVKQQNDFKEILAANKKMNELVSTLKKDLDDLDNRFNKDGRDFGKIAIEKTGAINRIINKGSDNASRCIEIASVFSIAILPKSRPSLLNLLSKSSKSFLRTPTNSFIF